MWWIGELSSSIKFLFLSESLSFWKSKRIYEFVLPGILTLVFVGLYFHFPKFFLTNALDKASSNVFNFMIFVVPFHLAALGAFSTFSSKELDKDLAGAKVELKVWDNADNDYYYKRVTLRQYGSLLFGYLCSIGVIYILIYLFFSMVDVQSNKNIFSDNIIRVSLIINIFFISHYFILTLYGITFIFDKINKIGSGN